MSETQAAGTVEQTINNLEVDPHYERVNHPAHHAAVPVAAVFRVPTLVRDNTAYTLVTTEGDTVTVVPHGERCDCGENEKYSPRMGTAVKTAHRKRRAANCQHANTALDAKDLGPCDECGAWGFDVKQHSDGIGNVILEEYYCAECGEYRGC